MSIQCLLVNFVMGKYLNNRDTIYIRHVITSMISLKKLHGIQYIHLRIHYETYQHFKDLKYLTILECIHMIYDEINKPISIIDKHALINSYLFCLERGHIPNDCEIVEDVHRRFDDAGICKTTKLDEFIMV